MSFRQTVTGSFDTAVTIESKPSGGSWSTYGTYYVGSQRTKDILSQDTPNFTKLRKCGEFLPLNTCEIRDITVTRQPGAVSCQVNDSSNTEYRGQSWFDNYVVPAGFIPTPDASLTEAAVLSAAANCIGEAWDVLTFSATLNQTAKTIASAGRRFNSLTLQMALRAKRKAKKDPASVYRYFRDLWLEARYGIRPIMYDAYDAANFLSKMLNGEIGGLITGRGRQTETFNKQSGEWTHYDITWDILDDLHYSSTFIHRGIAYHAPKKLGKHGLVADPLVTAWELMPYSFVVDWFVDIGSWVQTLSPQVSNVYLGIGSSLRVDSTFSGERIYRVKPGRGTGTWSNGKKLVTAQTYYREPSTIPFPSLLPRLTIPKLVDLFGLFVQGRQRVNNVLRG
jgi:hypothetical protein